MWYHVKHQKKTKHIGIKQKIRETQESVGGCHCRRLNFFCCIKGLLTRKCSCIALDQCWPAPFARCSEHSRPESAWNSTLKLYIWLHFPIKILQKIYTPLKTNPKIKVWFKWVSFSKNGDVQVPAVSCLGGPPFQHPRVPIWKGFQLQ